MNFFVILLVVFFAVAFAIHKLQFFAHKEKSFKNEEFRKTLNLALEARNQGTRSMIARQNIFSGRAPANETETLQRGRTSYSVVGDYHAVPAETNSSAPQLNGFAIQKGTSTQSALVVRNHRTGSYGVFTRRFKVRYRDEQALNSLKAESRIKIEFEFPEIRLALIGVTDSNFSEIKTWLEEQPGILKVDFEILEDRPGVLK